MSGKDLLMTLITVNGVIAESVSALDRGLAYGDGVFETCRVQNGKILLWSYHVKRLMQGLSRLSIVGDPSLIESLIKKAIDLAPVQYFDNGVLKLIVTRGVGARGYGFDENSKATIICFVSAAPAVNDTPIKLPLLNTRLGCSSALAGMKHLNRLENVLLKAECQRLGVADGLAANESGFIIETTLSNVFFKFPDGWRTPRLNESGVSGVMRQLVLDRLMPENKIDVCEADISFEHLPQVTAAFCCNSVRGLTAIEAVGDKALSIDESYYRLVDSLKATQDSLRK